MDLIDRMLGHDHWAMTQILEVCRGLTDEQLDREFDIGHRSVSETFDHLIYNLGFWTAMMAGQQPDPPRAGREYDRSMPAQIDRYEQYFASFAAFARRMRDEQRLEETFVDHFGGTPTFGGVIIHLTIHNAEHRSEVLHILQRLGVENLPEIDPALWDQTAQVALKDIREERALWHALLAEVGEDRMEEPGPMGDWTFKDLAAHLLGWRSRTIGLIEAGPDGNPPTPWPSSLTTDDEINAWIYEQNRDRPLRDVLEDLDQSFERLANIIERVPEGDLTAPGRFAWTGDQRLFQIDFSGHLREEHEPAIRAWLQSR
ncbi:MAG TPA: DinB family protein [Thermomicrobiales bacterium]|nr:DinB family protein [Thermomicrobiales bacterium]